VPLLLPPLAGGERGRAPLDVARERERGAPHVGEAPARLDAHVDVDAARARGLGPADEPDGVERLARHCGNLPHLRPLDARPGIEIDPQLVGVIEGLGAHRVRVQIDAAEVDHPRELRRVAHHQLVGGAPRRERQLHRLHPRRPLLGRALLVEELALGPVHVALELHRPPAGAAQRALGDRQVVLDEIALGVAGAREHHLVGMRDRHLAARHRDHHESISSSANPGSPSTRRLRPSSSTSVPLKVP
jgi:hypothetical protein